MRVADFDFELPPELIAQTPAEPRDSSRLMTVQRQTGEIDHHIFRDLPALLRPDDVLVLNDTRVRPARLHARRHPTGGAVELLLLRRLDDLHWRALVGGRGLRSGAQVVLPNGTLAVIERELDGPERIIAFEQPIDALLADSGEVPLPPYIHAPLADAERYQTVYARHEESAAAPTAGLHFTPELLAQLRDIGVSFAFCTLEIGLGTFQPVKAETVSEHVMHSERARLNADNARLINEAKLAGRRVVAVGTTAARTLESAAILSEGGDIAAPDRSPDACPWRPVVAFEGETNLFIYPGYRWRVVDALITNFHLPKSTLIMMISSFTGVELAREAYATAIRDRYRFFSFGDAMFIA